jgi:DNA-directed RNA polymerase subunit RPC12/RpoP
LPVQPKPYKLVCPKCGYSKVVSLKSDFLSLKDLISMSPVCSKCKEQMDRESVDKLESVIDSLFGMFK